MTRFVFIYTQQLGNNMILGDFEGNYLYDPIRYLNFNENLIDKDTLFCFGLGIQNKRLNEIKNLNIKKKIYLCLEEPNSFFMPYEYEVRKRIIEDTFDKILTLCKFSASVYDKRESVFFPFNFENLKGINVKKNKDVIYTGHIFDTKLVNNIINSISKFEYNSISKDDSYFDKLKKISETKISVCHNLILPEQKFIDYFVKTKVFKEKLYMFTNMHDFYVPQIKSRIFEAAFCKSLILCYKDDFNVIEDFFEENKHFIYYNDYDDLEKKIRDIINNYNDYQKIIENAYDFAIKEYTTDSFIKKYIL